jgi:hypothetical protein
LQHVRGIRHTHSATALGGAHPRVYSPECVELDFSHMEAKGVGYALVTHSLKERRSMCVPYPKR